MNILDEKFNEFQQVATEEKIERFKKDNRLFDMIFSQQLSREILKRIYKLYGEKTVPLYVMPMIISRLGNSSVATLPMLLDMVIKNKLKNYELKSGDIIVFASVGAGMHINSMVYRVP